MASSEKSKSIASEKASFITNDKFFPLELIILTLSSQLPFSTMKDVLYILAL